MLSAYLQRVETPENPDGAAALLSELLINRNAPAEARDEIVDSLLLGAELASSNEIREAGPGVRALSRITEFEPSIRGLVSAEVLRSISRNYDALVRRGVIRRNPALESGPRIE